MNKLLPKVVPLVLTYFLFINPLELKAQCECEAGAEPNLLEYVVVLNHTTLSNTVISFPKFDPALGTLTCVTLDDTISIASTTGIRNYDSAETEYIFDLSVNTKVEGPSLSRINSKSTEYGPDLLGAIGSATDTVNYGPDSLYNNWASTKTNTSNMTPYLGATGTVNFTYTIGGGVIAIGGVNYNAQVRTVTWGVFKLTYKWCNNSVLASAIKNFSVTKTGDVVGLQWHGPDNSAKNNFEIQISKNGTSFSKLAAGTNAVESSSGKYKYQYKIDNTVNGKLYYRIKYSDRGTTLYSAVRIISSEPLNGSMLTIFPNPAHNALNVNFEESVTGNYQIELYNQAGQMVLKRNLILRNNRSVSLPVNDPPPPGVYYLKAISEGASKVYTGKLLFTR